MVTLTNDPGWYLWTLVNTATKSKTVAYPIGGQQSTKIGIPKVWFLGLFGLKTGWHFARFGLVSGMILEGFTGVYDIFVIWNPNE